MKKNKSDKNNNEEKTKVVDQTIYSGQEEFSLQNISYDPGENDYLNESKNKHPYVENQRNHEFSEQLSDDGERDLLIEKQSNNNYGDL